MNDRGDGYDYKKKQMSHAIKESKKSGTGFNYDPSNYKDSANEGNYRRLSDQMAAVKAEEEKLAREREELIRKEKMEKLLIQQENQTFWETPGDKIVATSDKYFVPPGVIEVINDLDNQVSHAEFKVAQSCVLKEIISLTLDADSPIFFFFFNSSSASSP